MKQNLKKHIDYVLKSKPRQKLWINEKKLTFTSYPPIKKNAFRSNRKIFVPKRIWKKKEIKNNTSLKFTTKPHTTYFKKSYYDVAGSK